MAAATTALRIGVTGGSIAGCAAAAAGSWAGAHVTVDERSGAELQDRGFGIVIPPPLHRELVESGYLDAEMETATVATRVWLTREPGDRTTACHPVADMQLPRAARSPLLLAGDAAGVSRPHTASGAVKALQDALCLERVLREEPTAAVALERYADERTAAGVHLVELGRRMGRAQVEETPDWAAMGQDEVDVRFRGVLAGTRHYLYEQPGAGVTA